MTMPSSRPFYQKPIINQAQTSSIDISPTTYMSSQYKYPVYIRFQPDTLTDGDKDVVAEYCKTNFSNCLVAKESVPISQVDFLHGGGLCKKRPVQVARELHAKLGFEKDPAVMTYHNNYLVRSSDGSRSLVNANNKGNNSSKEPSLIVKLFTTELYNFAADGYWTSCPPAAKQVYMFKELSADMMATTPPCFEPPNGGGSSAAKKGGESSNFINDWYAAMVDSEGCHHPTTISVPEHLIYNYNILLMEGKILPITSQTKLNLMLAQFYQAVCQTSTVNMHSIGLEFIPSAKDIKELRQCLLKRKRDEFEGVAHKIAFKFQRDLLPNFTDGVPGYDVPINRQLAKQVYEGIFGCERLRAQRKFFGDKPYDSKLTLEEYHLEVLSKKYGV